MQDNDPDNDLHLKFSLIAADCLVSERAEEDDAFRKDLKKRGRRLLSDAREVSDSRLTDELAELGYHVAGRAAFGAQAESFISAEEMTGALLDTKSGDLKPDEVQQIWQCLTILWQRWLPDQPSFEMIHDRMMTGYDNLQENPELAMELWTRAWADIRTIVQHHDLVDIDQFDSLFRGAVATQEWLTDLFDELANAGDRNPQFFEDRLRIATEALPLVSGNVEMTEEVRIAKAETICLMGRLKEAEQLYQEWLTEDPKWGRGWDSWSECHWLLLEKHCDFDTALAIVKRGAEVPGVRQECELIESIIELAQEAGQEAEAAKWSDRLQRKYQDRYYEMDVDDRLPSVAAEPITQAGRNDPCPCGSGKKYKKCCVNKERFQPALVCSKHEESAAVGKLVSFSERSSFDKARKQAMEVFWPEQLLRNHTQEEIQAILAMEHNHVNFMGWFLFDRADDESRTIADLFLASRPPGLSDAQVVHLRRLKAAYCRPYEVRKVFPDKGFEMLDIWTGRDVFVRERAATRSVHRWDLVIARLLRYADGVHEIAGSLFVFPAQWRKTVTERLDEEYHEFYDRERTTDRRRFFHSICHLFHHWWLELVAFPPLPELRTSDGELVAPGKAVFQVRDQQALREALCSIPGIEEAGPGQYVWQKPEPSQTHLGSIRLTGSELVLETLSSERLELGKTLLHERAGGLLSLRETIITGQRKFLEEARRKAIAEGPSLSNDDERNDALNRQLLPHYFLEHYRKWMDQPIAVLENHTPRQAVHVKRLRPLLVDLLKEIENAHSRGDQPYDVSWLWNELGIEAETN